ncbi:phage major capsid protein [Escherichia coli]|nr:phage major capsid protein [Escherichia coli]
MQTKQRLDVPLSLKSVSDSGEFEGYGSVFGVKDSHDDVVMSGAFAASLRAWSDRKALPALLWQHRMDEPIGVYTEMKEDDVGLYVRGRLLIDDDPLAKRAHAHMKAGSLRAFGKLQHIVSGDATAVTADAIIKLIYTLRKAHRTGAKFMMNNNSLFAIRLLKDSEGNYLWRPGLELGQPSSLAGYGIAENEQMPDIAADAKAIAFGNFKRGYTIVDRIGTRILRDPYTNKPFVGFYTTKRTGGMLVDSQAIKLLKIAVA